MPTRDQVFSKVGLPEPPSDLLIPPHHDVMEGAWHIGTGLPWHGVSLQMC